MKRPKGGGILLQVAIMFLIGTAITGMLTYVVQSTLSKNNVKRQTLGFASVISDEVGKSVKEYPAYEWLMNYWYEHGSEMDIEYDVDFGPGTQTEEKCRLLSEHYPGIQLRYLTQEDLLTMTEEDRRIYAEIVYSWLITRVNQIKQSYHVSYLFCVATDDSYESQFFLFSAGTEGSVRGANYEDVYTLGTTATVAGSQSEAMRSAVQNNYQLADAGKYVDVYSFLMMLGEHPVLIGMTYNLSRIQAEVEAESLRDTFFSGALQICLALLCLMMIAYVVLRPLKTVQKNISLYAQTKDSQRVSSNLEQIHVQNEIGQLARDVTALTKEMDEHLAHIKAITKEKERIDTELSLASRIQADMLPNVFPAFPDRNEFEVYASMTPAKEVGGDFYDFFLIDEDHLCLLIADVSGKGIPAALFMMALKIMLSNNAMMGESPAKILGDVNASICVNNREEMFVTVWLGILEISTGRLTAANAGHEYPVLKKAGGCFELLKDKHGFVIGGMEGIRYSEYEVMLEPGSKLFVYTDGVPEATDKEQVLFGTERMLVALNEEAQAEPKRILEHVQEAVNGFVQEAEQFDDLTMLCLEYKGKI